jgi:hypothetical protein
VNEQDARSERVQRIRRHNLVKSAESFLRSGGDIIEARNAVEEARKNVNEATARQLYSKRPNA